MNETANEYKNVSKEELIQDLVEMKEVINQLQSDRNKTELLSFPWLGNLGHWNWMVGSNQLVFNEKKATNLGYKSEDIPDDVGFEFFTTKLHPDDYDQVMDNMSRHLKGLSDAYEVEYRIRKKDGGYAWYYDRGKVTKRNKKGEAILVSGIVFDISINKNMETELKEMNEQLKKLVVTDDLTKAFNKRYMFQKLHNEIQHYERTNVCFSLMMLDIDKFKSINDEFGHNTGDSVLKKVVETIKNEIREIDMVSRWGGDEFVILLPNTHAADAAIVAERVRVAISKLSNEGFDPITVSIGVSDYCGTDSVDEAIAKVDELMYASKFEGGNSVRASSL